VQFIRKFCLVFASFCTLWAFSSPAWANPELLVDMATGEVLHQQDAGLPWHPASLTKLMTAYVAFRAIAEGRVTLDTPVVVSRAAWNQAPAKSGLPIGASLTLKDALYVMLVKSANDIAVAIAETVGAGDAKSFVDAMNASAQALGLTATHYNNPNGLPDPGQVTSARDLAVLALVIHRDFPQYLPMFGTAQVMLGKAKLKSENNLLTHFDGTTGMKTGFICASGLNMVATVQRDGRGLLAVILGGASARERGEKAAEMVLRGLAGSYSDTGVNIAAVANDTAKPPADMQSQICGKQAKSYAKAHAAAFPMGMKGKPSYLNDKIVGPVYVANAIAPAATAAAATVAPDAPGTAAEGSGEPVAGSAALEATIADAPIPMPRIERSN
jgi:D-alanyl-D-alanine carboxypeptidase